MLYPLLQALTASLVALGSVPSADLPGNGEARPTVALSELYAKPTQHLGSTVRFTVQWDQLQADWQPFHTRFGPERFRAARVWSDDQRLWDPEQFHAPLGLLFVPKGTPAERDLLRAPRFQRFVIYGTVRNTLLGRPWIEVHHAFRSQETVGEGTLLHASRALRWLDRGALEMARQELERALVPRLPQAVREDLETLLLHASA